MSQYKCSVISSLIYAHKIQYSGYAKVLYLRQMHAKHLKSNKTFFKEFHVKHCIICYLFFCTISLRYLCSFPAFYKFSISPSYPILTGSSGKSTYESFHLVQRGSNLLFVSNPLSWSPASCLLIANRPSSGVFRRTVYWKINRYLYMKLSFFNCFNYIKGPVDNLWGFN